LGAIQIAWIDLHASFPDVAERKEVLNPRLHVHHF
jgi:hypothetical protein